MSLDVLPFEQDALIPFERGEEIRSYSCAIYYIEKIHNFLQISGQIPNQD